MADRAHVINEDANKLINASINQSIHFNLVPFANFSPHISKTYTSFAERLIQMSK